MQFTIFTIAALVAAVSAGPIEQRQQGELCSGLGGNPLCCATLVDGVLGVGCNPGK